MLLLVLYGLAVLLLILVSRPRLVIYNAAAADVRRVLGDAAGQLDADARWAGDALLLPTLGVQLTIESSAYMRNVRLLSTGSYQRRGGWRQLDRKLTEGLRPLRTAPNPRGVSMVLFAIGMIGLIAVQLTRHGAGIAEALQEMLRL